MGWVGAFPQICVDQKRAIQLEMRAGIPSRTEVGSVGGQFSLIFSISGLISLVSNIPLFSEWFPSGADSTYVCGQLQLFEALFLSVGNCEESNCYK